MPDRSSYSEYDTREAWERFVSTGSSVDERPPKVREEILDSWRRSRDSGVDAASLVAVYLRYYPLFQEAYADLGQSGRHFNDRMIHVIDHLLAAPEISSPIKLVRPKVQYRFADPGLEALSSGQKAMIRIGPAHAKTVKRKLRQIRAEILRQTQQADLD